MLRIAVLRGTRLPRAASMAGSSIAAGVRPVLRTGSLLATASTGAAACGPASLVVPLVSRLSFAGFRTFSGSAARAAEATTEATAQSGAETEESLPNPTKFSELEKYGIHKNLVRSITEGMGYDSMTPVQTATIGPALTGKDLVAQAKTGTGKTLAFLVPMIQNMIEQKPHLAEASRQHRARPNDILGIVVSPTRELAEQISREAQKLCKDTGIIVDLAVGGTQKGRMLDRIRHRGCHLLVATPGRLSDLLSDPRSSVEAPNLSCLVLDEADRMLDVGFEDTLRDILTMLPNRRDKARQTMLFSATIPGDVIKLARQYVDAHNFEFVQTINPDEVPTHESVPQRCVAVRGFENLYPSVLELMRREHAACQARGEGFKAIVFLPTTAFVQLTNEVFSTIARDAAELGLPPISEIHSQLTQQRRTRAANDFRRSTSGILMSSDVTARGIDFPNVTHVIQIGLPPDREQYIHRIGRTGRAGKTGQGFLFVNQTDTSEMRHILRGLPIQRDDSLTNAGVDLEAVAEEAQPDNFRYVRDAMKRVPRLLAYDTYTAFFSNKCMGRDNQERLNILNKWVRLGWGWDKPPEITRRLAEKRGLLRLRGLNLASESPSKGWDSDAGDVSTDDFSSKFSANADDQDRGSWGSRGSSGGGSYGRGSRPSYGDRGDRGGDRGGRGRFSDRNGRSGFSDRGGRGGYSDRNGRSSYGDRSGRSNFSDRNGRGSRNSRGFDRRDDGGEFSL